MRWTENKVQWKNWMLIKKRFCTGQSRFLYLTRKGNGFCKKEPFRNTIPTAYGQIPVVAILFPENQILMLLTEG